ncbi:MAG: selenide, water dikinase SelD [Gemmataceae bacterium]
MTAVAKKRLTEYASCAGCAAKIPPGRIGEILRHLPDITDANLLVGTQTRDDAGVYQLTSDLALVQTIDFFPPMVDDPYIYGQIAAANALSDVYAMGGEPKTGLNLVGFPDDQLELDLLGTILDGGAERFDAAGAVIVGGHTVRDAEVKFGYAVTGIIHPKQIVTNAGARPGDVLILTKPIGTGFVTAAHKKGLCPEPLLKRACASMVQLNIIGRDAMLAAGANAATDVTGFSLSGHAREMADGANVTIRLKLDAVPTFEGIEELIRAKHFTRASKTNREYAGPALRFEREPDPTRSEILFDPQTSGGLLIAVPAANVDRLIRDLKEGNAAAAAVVGEVLPRGDVALLIA